MDGMEAFTALEFLEQQTSKKKDEIGSLQHHAKFWMKHSHTGKYVRYI